MTPELRDALLALKSAVRDEGPMPTYHRRVMAETYQRWPTLWLAVEKVLAAPEVRTMEIDN